MEHRRIRSIVQDISMHFYTCIKDKTEWEEVDAIAQEYHAKYAEDAFADDLIRAYIAEWCKGNLKDKNKERE